MSDRAEKARLTVRVFNDGAMSIEGPIDDTVWTLALLDHVRDAVKRRAQQRAQNTLIIPSSGLDKTLLR